VVVAGVLCGFASSELLSGARLRLRVEIFNLGFAEDAKSWLIQKYCEGRQSPSYIQVLLDGDLYTSGWLMTKRICEEKR